MNLIRTLFLSLFSLSLAPSLSLSISLPYGKVFLFSRNVIWAYVIFNRSVFCSSVIFRSLGSRSFLRSFVVLLLVLYPIVSCSLVCSVVSCCALTSSLLSPFSLSLFLSLLFFALWQSFVISRISIWANLIFYRRHFRLFVFFCMFFNRSSFDSFARFSLAGFHLRLFLFYSVFVRSLTSSFNSVLWALHSLVFRLPLFRLFVFVSLLRTCLFFVRSNPSPLYVPIFGALRCSIISLSVSFFRAITSPFFLSHSRSAIPPPLFVTPSL